MQEAPTFHLHAATAEDLPAILKVAAFPSTSDTHTHLKAIVKGYGSSAEGVARYHAECMKPAFEQMIRKAGFANTKVEPIMGGLVAIHSGWKI